jgi:hypothetical protein
MNFFGHAVVAGWFSEAEPFVLGSMLPDFANVLGVRPPRSQHIEVRAGIELHHETDRVFHDCEAFRELEDTARSSLAAAGVSKGARRALAHIGVEFLIDAELSRRAPGWKGYASALRYGMSESCGGALEWRSGDGHPMSRRLAGLCSRLAASSGFSADARVLARRLLGVLAGRPRLALEPEELPHVESWLAEHAPRVVALTPQLLGELGRGLRAGRADAASA